MVLNIPTNHALDRMLEKFLESTGVTDPIINEELVMEAFYEGARAAYAIFDLQTIEDEDDIEHLLSTGNLTPDDLNCILQAVVFDEANYDEEGSA